MRGGGDFFFDWGPINNNPPPSASDKTHQVTWTLMSLLWNPGGVCVGRFLLLDTQIIVGLSPGSVFLWDFAADWQHEQHKTGATPRRGWHILKNVGSTQIPVQLATIHRFAYGVQHMWSRCEWEKNRETVPVFSNGMWTGAVSLGQCAAL